MLVSCAAGSESNQKTVRWVASKEDGDRFGPALHPVLSKRSVFSRLKFLMDGVRGMFKDDPEEAPATTYTTPLRTNMRVILGKYQKILQRPDLARLTTPAPTAPPKSVKLPAPFVDFCLQRYNPQTKTYSLPQNIYILCDNQVREILARKY